MSISSTGNLPSIAREEVKESALRNLLIGEIDAVLSDRSPAAIKEAMELRLAEIAMEREAGALEGDAPDAEVGMIVEALQAPTDPIPELNEGDPAPSPAPPASSVPLPGDTPQTPRMSSHSSSTPRLKKITIYPDRSHTIKLLDTLWTEATDPDVILCIKLDFGEGRTLTCFASAGSIEGMRRGCEMGLGRGEEGEEGKGEKRMGGKEDVSEDGSVSELSLGDPFGFGDEEKGGEEGIEGKDAELAKGGMGGHGLAVAKDRAVEEGQAGATTSPKDPPNTDSASNPANSTPQPKPYRLHDPPIPAPEPNLVVHLEIRPGSKFHDPLNWSSVRNFLHRVEETYQSFTGISKVWIVLPEKSSSLHYVPRTEHDCLWYPDWATKVFMGLVEDDDHDVDWGDEWEDIWDWMDWVEKPSGVCWKGDDVDISGKDLKKLKGELATYCPFENEDGGTADKRIVVRRYDDSDLVREGVIKAGPLM